MEIKRKPRGDKIFRGAYSYYKADKLYAEEEFEVFKDRKELGVTFFGTLHSRVQTGELLSVYIDFSLTKEFNPQKLLVERSLGNEVVREIYDFNPRNNVLDYVFINSKGQEHVQVQVPPKFGLTTPLACASMLFLKMKKEDTMAKNFFQTISSNNLWIFENDPYQQTLCAERMALGTENINIEGQTLQALPYKVWDAEDIKDNNDEIEHLPFINVKLSKHLSIPYSIRSQDGVRIQIKYLNDLDKE